MNASWILNNLPQQSTNITNIKLFKQAVKTKIHLDYAPADQHWDESVFMTQNNSGCTTESSVAKNLEKYRTFTFQ